MEPEILYLIDASRLRGGWALGEAGIPGENWFLKWKAEDLLMVPSYSLTNPVLGNSIVPNTQSVVSAVGHVSVTGDGF